MLSRTLGNRYEIIELIGRGGMAYVYKARDLKLNRYVAVKVLREEYTENEQFIKKFDRESQAVACLSHPNIVGVYDVGVQDNIYYIIMEYVDGITLKQYLVRKGRLDYTEATRFIIDIANALKCAHENKIIHRDIKPHNILLTRDLIPKVADFGIARAITSSTVTMTNQTMGSVHYISPEQAKGGFVDERSDLYSLGILFYELLTGKVPFDEENTVTIAIKHIQEKITPPKEMEPKIPEVINQVVIKLTEKKPDDRYQNTDELIEDLEAIMQKSNGVTGDNLLLGNMRNEPQVMREGLFSIEDTGNQRAVEEEEDDEYYYETPEETAKRKKKRKIILFSIFGGLLAIALAMYAVSFFGAKSVIVPDLKGKTVAEATKSLENLKLKIEVEKEIYSNEVPAGIIISQNPEKGQELTGDKTVKVIVSLGVKTAAIPNVVGMTETEAKKVIGDAKFIVGEVKRLANDNYDKDIVYEMSPTAGTTANEGSKIVLYVSRGQELLTVPDIIGETESNAKTSISEAGLVSGEIFYEESSTYSKGTVIRQSPSGGSEVAKNSSVSYTVSSGKISTQKLSINLTDYDKTTPPKSVKVKVVLSTQEGTEKTIYEGTNMSNDTFSVNVEGIGRQIYEVFIDNVSVGSNYIDF